MPFAIVCGANTWSLLDDAGGSENVDNRWAIILNSTCDLEHDLTRYSNECVLVYETLRMHGYAANHIFVLGGEYEANCQYATTYQTEYNSKKVLATYSAWNSVINNLSTSINGGDLLVYVTGPSDINRIAEHYYQNAYLKLWGDVELSDIYFATSLASIPATNMNIIIQSDYAGGFVYEIQNTIQSNYVLSVACMGTERAIPRYDNYLGEFTYWWLTAVNGTTPNQTGNYSADINNNATISMFEAFLFAEKHDTSDENSEIISVPECLAYELTLYGQSDAPCVNPNLTQGYDLYIKDNIEDEGDEPNNTTTKAYISQDVWFEDSYKNKTYTLGSNSPCSVCVNIHNRGTLPTSGNEKLHIHWTKATIGGQWPYGWNEGNYYDCDGSLVETGAEITPLEGLELPSIESGKSVTIRYPWTTPSTDTYADCSIFNNNVNEIKHYCILARLYDDNAHPGEDLQTVNLKDFILGSNNVISRNFVIEYWKSDVPVRLVAPPNEEGTYYLAGDMKYPLTSAYDIYLYLDDALYDLYTSTGSSTGLVEDSIGKFRIVSPNFRIDHLSLLPNHLYYVKVGIEQHDPIPYRVSAGLSLYNQTSNHFIGGQQVEFDMSEYSSDGAEASNQELLNKPQRHTKVEAKTTGFDYNNVKTCLVYSSTGQLLHIGHNVEDCMNLNPGLYIVLIETNSGDIVQYKELIQ